MCELLKDGAVFCANGSRIMCFDSQDFKSQISIAISYRVTFRNYYKVTSVFIALIAVERGVTAVSYEKFSVNC